MIVARWRLPGPSSAFAIAALVAAVMLVSTLAADEPDEAAARRCLACGTAQRAALESIAPRPNAAAYDDDADGVAVTDLSSIRTDPGAISSRRGAIARRAVAVETPAERLAAILHDTSWSLLPLALKAEGLLPRDGSAAPLGGARGSLQSRLLSRQPVAGPAFPTRVNPLR